MSPLKMEIQKEELTNISQTAEMVGLPISTLWHYVRIYKVIPAPATKRGNRRFYNQQQLAEVVVQVNELRKRGYLNGK